MTEQMSVYKALKTLKVTDEKIERGSYTTFVAASKNGRPTDRSCSSPEEMRKKAKSNMDKMRDLLVFRAKLKSAIVQSNAVTKVNIPILGEVTVAEAIEYKSSIQVRKQFVQTVQSQLSSLMNLRSRAENEIEKETDARIATLMGRDSAKTPDPAMVKSIRETLEKERAVEIYGEGDLNAWLETELDDIQQFDADIDDILNESNVKTSIEV